MANAATAQRSSGLGNIAFLNNLGRDVFFLGQIGSRINVSVQPDGSIRMTIRSRVRLSLDWVTVLRLVFRVGTRFELHEVAHLSFTRSSRILTLKTEKRRDLRPHEVFGEQYAPGAILFLADSAARLIQTQAIS
ncbi:TPA: hypothetical protein DEA21_01575 [Candidatus Uhrbacteria bacterium]|nr:hypothetical protein [Candidatus Uhrbacteria bacterium]